MASSDCDEERRLRGWNVEGNQPRQVPRGRSTDTGEGEGEKFMTDAKPNSEPVEFFQHWSDRMAFLGPCDDPGSDVLNMLWALQPTLRGKGVYNRKMC